MRDRNVLIGNNSRERLLRIVIHSNFWSLLLKPKSKIFFIGVINIDVVIAQLFYRGFNRITCN